MFAVEMLPAGHGDAVVVEWDSHRLLIDAGTLHSWDDVRARLKQRRTDAYELFVVTHIDEDHIGGAIALLDDPDLRHRVSSVWFNGFVHCDAPRLEREESGTLNVLGPVNGEQLTERIRNTGLEWNEPLPWGPVARSRGVDIGGPVVVPDDGDLPTLDLPGDARLVLLSPTADRLERMAEVWEEKVTEAGLVPGEGDADHNQAPSPFDKEVDELPDVVDRDALKTMASQRKRDRSAANASSIAFVLEFDGKRVLLAGDAHASVLAESLIRYGKMVGEPVPRIDLVKLSHHGSGANVSATMLKRLRCDRFLISTNADNFGHPDDSAIARLILADDAPSTFYCNYRSPRTLAWSDAEVREVPTPVFTLPQEGKSGLRVAV